MESVVRRVAVKTEIKPPYRTILYAEIPRGKADEFNSLQGKDLEGYTIDIRKKRKSKNMNSYMWVLCNEIAKKIESTKEDVYREAVRDVGKWVDVTVSKDEAKSLYRSWQNNGEGWFVEPLHIGERIAELRCYIGSSTYDANELTRLTKYIVDEAKALDIETMTPSELERMKQLWK